MAALPPESTERWFLDYTVSGVEHTWMCRTATGKSASEASSYFTDVLDLFEGALFEWTVTGLRKSAIGSNVSLPQTWGGDTTYGTGTAVSTIQRAHAFSFTGRDEEGHKIRMFLYGVNAPTEGDYRFDTSESAGVDAVVDYLNSVVGGFITIAGNAAVWNAYANSVIPIFWQKKLRKLGG